MDNIVYVYNKNRELIAQFDGQNDVVSEDDMRNTMVSPTVHIETNGSSTLTFQMLVESDKWDTIKDPENIYVLNDREYTALSDKSYEFTGDEGVPIVNVTLVETWYLLSKKYTQAFNCGIYSTAKAKFVSISDKGAVFTISATDCTGNGSAISDAIAWEQVKNWDIKDEDGNNLTFQILQSDGNKPTNWEDAPTGVFIVEKTVSGDNATVTIDSRGKVLTKAVFGYDASNVYTLPEINSPHYIKGVTLILNSQHDEGDETVFRTYEEATTAYTNVGNNAVNLNSYTPPDDTKITSVIVEYELHDLGSIKSGATCVLAYGAEAVDEHTVKILPRADQKYYLYVNGVKYSDSAVVDGDGRKLPRGSAGYAVWALLRCTGWELGTCDVIVKGFDASIDYGSYNVESDMKDVLTNIQEVQSLYGGILDWDSKNKVLNYRAENADDYDIYPDGFTNWTGYEFREGKNMVGQPKIQVDNSLITKAYVLGYGNLNVKNVNDGKPYVEDHSYTDAVYEGYIEQPLIYDTNDDGGMKQLLNWGKKEVSKLCRPRKSIQVECKDIRMVPGFEHETFDINDVVRVYYKDNGSGEETFEEKRITKWEYNAFALEDSSVEIGDKTQNLQEVFRLIYKKSVKEAPKTNGSGQISSTDMTVRVPKSLSEYIGGGGGGGGGGSAEDTLEDYIELIARTTTENSDAIAGLTLHTNELMAESNLFSQYQKQTDGLLSTTYSGLRTYADENIAELLLYVHGEFYERDENLEEYKTTVAAGFESSISRDKAMSEQFSTFKQETNNSITESNASIKTVADNLSAQIDLEASHKSEIDGKISANSASIKTVADNLSAQIDLEASHKSEIDGKISANSASIKTLVDENQARIDFETKVNDKLGRLTVSDGGTYVYAANGATNSYLGVQGGSTILHSAIVGIGASTYLNISSDSIRINGKVAFDGGTALNAKEASHAALADTANGIYSTSIVRDSEGNSAGTLDSYIKNATVKGVKDYSAQSITSTNGTVYSVLGKK